MGLHPEEVVRVFLNALSESDLQTASAMLADDAMYISALGERLVGKPAYTAALKLLFDRGVGFRIDIEEVMVEGETASVRGQTTSEDPVLEADYIWSCQVENGLIKRCQGHRIDASMPELARVLSGAEKIAPPDDESE